MNGAEGFKTTSNCYLWKMLEPRSNQNSFASDSELDLRELLQSLWKNRKIIAVSSLVAFAAATYYAFAVVKPTFESSAILLPTQSPSTDLGAASAIFGKKSAGSADVDLYQSLLTSRTVIQKLLLAPIQNVSDTGKGRTVPLFHILKLDTTNPVLVEGAVKSLAKSVVVGSKESGEGGLLEIKFSASSPWLAQQLGNAVLSIGQEELRLVRIKRSEVIMSRLVLAVGQAKAEWDSSARVLTWYKDRNRSIVLPEQFLEISRLEIEKRAKEQKYLQARGEYDAQSLERAKAAPPMMILDPANLPSSKSKPKRSLIMLLGLIIGGAGSSFAVIARESLAARNQNAHKDLIGAA